MAKQPRKVAAPRAPRSMEQLLNATWETQSAAMAELKRCKHDELSQYQLIESAPGIWLLAEIADATAPDPEPPELAPEAPAKKGAATAAAIKEGFGARTRGGNAAPLTKAEKKAAEKAAKEAAAKAAEAKETEAKEAAAMFMQPLPKENGPYRLVLQEGEGFPAHATHTWAREISKILKVPVGVYDKDMNLIGTCDWRSLPRNGNGGAAKTPRTGATAKRTEPTDMQAQLIKLATRKNGVTRGEIAKDVSDRKLAWTTMIKECERFGYSYSTSEAAEGRGGRTVYHLTKTA